MVREAAPADSAAAEDGAACSAAERTQGSASASADAATLAALLTRVRWPPARAAVPSSASAPSTLGKAVETGKSSMGEEDAGHAVSVGGTAAAAVAAAAG